MTQRLAVAYRAINELRPYARNPRRYSEDQIGQVVKSIEEFGWTIPLLIDDTGELIAGHRRLLAAKMLGLDEVPTIDVAHLTPEQKRAYLIADNQLTINGGWDDAMLSEEFQALDQLGFDTSLLGFSDEEMEALMAPLGTDPDEEAENAAPEPPETPVSQLGDLWLLGPHRAMCGDSTHLISVARLLNDEKPHLMVTDPPYGVSYDPDWRNRADRANGKPYGASAVGQVRNDDRADWSDAYKLFPGDVAYVWHHGEALQLIVGESLMQSRFDIRATIIWRKSRFPIGRGHYHIQHEPCFYAVRKGRTGHWQGSRKESTIWDITHMKSETGHGTQKPVECMRRPMQNNSAPGDKVYDPFLGSGTSIIAAETSRRICYGMELDPGYVDVIVRRWQEFTGKEAIDEDGRTFAEIALERGIECPVEPKPDQESLARTGP